MILGTRPSERPTIGLEALPTIKSFNRAISMVFTGIHFSGRFLVAWAKFRVKTAVFSRVLTLSFPLYCSVFRR